MSFRKVVSRLLSIACFGCLDKGNGEIWVLEMGQRKLNITVRNANRITVEKCERMYVGLVNTFTLKYRLGL